MKKRLLCTACFGSDISVFSKAVSDEIGLLENALGDAASKTGGEGGIV